MAPVVTDETLAEHLESRRRELRDEMTGLADRLDAVSALTTIVRRLRLELDREPTVEDLLDASETEAAHRRALLARFLGGDARG
jgi:hypothetical protein